MTAPDFYPTPEWVTETLIAHCPPTMAVVLEPCAGDGATDGVSDECSFCPFGQQVKAV